MEEFQLLQQVLSQCRDIKNELAELRQLTMLNKPMMTLNELRQYSGLSKASVYKLTSTGKIKHYKPTGGMLLFKKSEVDDFLVSNPVSTVGVSEAKSSDYLMTQSKKKKHYLNSKKQNNESKDNKNR